MRRVDAETSGGRKMFEEMGVLLAQKLEVCRRCKNKRLNRLMSEEFIGAKHPISPSPPSPTPSPHRYFYLNQERSSSSPMKLRLATLICMESWISIPKSVDHKIAVIGWGKVSGPFGQFFVHMQIYSSVIFQRFVTLKGWFFFVKEPYFSTYIFPVCWVLLPVLHRLK
ncbi:uncharacterized protein LOC120090251 isoform X1 [Benincasa hispida]|uniref:uncharacterized protein LOC120090251 isoform X1 n=1 Tax=Benincasa hispida TaxID=102211 RepID=UPI00190283F6|nr:uncharacterized protein LOC120090251 isoform X1 [Benincasa hispida]